MAVRPIFDPIRAGRPMRVAAFMSGSGTNIVKLLEHQKGLEAEPGGSPFQVIFIFSDRSDGACRGERIALEHGLPYFSYDTRAFHRIRGVKRTVKTPEGLAARKAYDEVARTLVRAFCVNVHPADLSILTPEGNRRFVGDRAVHDAIEAGEKSLRSSTLWTDEGVDTGPLLMVSEPLAVSLPEPLEELLRDRVRFDEVADAHQERLKEVGDWKIFPRTVEMIARGRFALDHEGRVYVDGRPVPEGFRE